MTHYFSTLEACNVSRIYDPYSECQQAIGNLWDANNLCNYTIGTQQKLGAPMVWIGNYVAAASLACFLAIAVDTFLGLRNRTFWFPCKFFTLNAATLTLLAVTMKLPLDLSNSMEGYMDQLAKLSSTVFMSVLMTNFMPSLGAMDDKEILLNLVALGILVITIIVNVTVQLITGAIPQYIDISQYIYTNLTYFVILRYSHIVVMISMFMLLVVLSVTALTIPTLRKILQLKYAKIHKVELKKDETVSVEKLKENVAKYWMMAKTGSPQFVISRSATCFASGTISLVVALHLSFVIIVSLHSDPFHYWIRDFSSDYKFSTSLICVVQTAAVVVGIIAPTFRCFTAAISNCSNKGRNQKTNVFSVETYWIQRLLEWKESSPSLPIQNQSFQKLFLNTIGLILDLFIVIQKVIVVASKVVRCIYNFFVKLALSCCHCINMLKQKLVSQTGASENQMRPEAESGTIELDLRPYVLLLEGEEELPAKTLKNISNSLNRIIEKAKAQHPRNLTELLKKCKGFNGVALFNSNQVLSLHSEEPPNGWSLVVATLTSIAAIALPSISRDVVNNLLCGVNESRLYIKQIEKSLDTKGNLVNTRKAADLVLFGVRTDCKWLDKDLKEMALKGKTFKEKLDCLAAVAKKIITDFKANINNDQIENPVDWPLKVLAANTMYRISKAISLEHETSDELTDYEVFEKISIMITDTIAACFTNLPRVIITKCYSCSIEKGEESVKAAARLLGETEEIMELVQKLKPPSLTADQMGDINEWSSIMKPQNPSISDFPSSKKPESSDVGEVQIVVD